MTYNFVIPLELEDLLKRNNVNHYVVDEVLSVRLLLGKLQECKSLFRMKGPVVIQLHFDVFYSILKHFDEVEPVLKTDLYKLLVNATTTLSNDLVEVLDNEMDPETRKERLNLVKMTTFLLCHLMKLFESTKPTAEVTGTGRGRKKSTKKHDGGVVWDDGLDGVRALDWLVQLHLHRLWDPPVPEDEFVTLVTTCCYKILETRTSASDKETRDCIFHLLGIMVKKYGHGLSCTIKIIQLLQHFENLASPLASAVHMWATEFGLKTLVGDLMREIGRMDPGDMARDISGTRAYASFLVELSEKVPDLMLPSICVLIPLLDGEPYTMRNGVLSVLGEVIIRTLSGDNMDDKMKSKRDGFLDILEEHIHDVNAYSRSKTLQVWINIVNEKKLPLTRQETLVELTLGRLHDKSSQVRKQAILLLTTLLQSNPFAGKLPLEELQVSYETEKAKLEEMMPEEPVTPNKGVHAELEEQWTTMEKEVREAVQLTLDSRDKDDGSQGEDSQCEDSQANAEPGDSNQEDGSREDSITSITDDDTADRVRERIVVRLKDCRYQSALRLLWAAREAFPGEACFSTPPSNVNRLLQDAEMSTEDERDDDDGEGTASNEVDDLLRCLRAIYLGPPPEPSPLTMSDDVRSAAIRRLKQLKLSNLQQFRDSTEMALIGATAETESTTPASPSGVVNEISKQQVLVYYLKDSLTFAKQIQAAMPVICQLLGSKSTSDVLEAIEFFVTGMEFGVASAITGIRRMLVLIWSKETVVKEAVVAAYRRLYLKPDPGNPKARALAIVLNLTCLVDRATMGDLTSLGELVCELVRSKEIDNRVIQTLWERFSMKIPKTTESDSRGALLLLTMAAGADVDIFRSNVDVLVKEGLGPRAERDVQLARDTCVALQKLSAEKTKAGTAPEKAVRFDGEHEMFQRLKLLIISGLTNKNTCYWVPMAEQAVNLIFKLAETPDAICGEILKRLAQLVLESSNTDSSTEGTDQNRAAPSVLLSRFLAFAGHVALRQLIHLDVNILNELKRRSALQENKAPVTKPNTNQQDKSDELTTEEEMGLAGASADDTETEYIRAITEQEIVTGSNLLAVIHPLILTVCNNPTRYTDANLQAAACLALAKYMLVSSQFCEQHLQLLFTVLEKSPHPVIRANTIVALGDLTFRFPNSIEPWTRHLYGRLRDPSPIVRKNTLMVLTHLILNDMVKVKGQISELASCIVDHDDLIQGRAKLFFFELSKKGNAVYNIMPDVISRLSDPDIGVPEENFRTIMKHLFSFIQKDRQCESLVEKLCHRFRATATSRQCRDLAFCLSLLTYSERSLRKLQENFACFATKLAEEDVYNSFCTIMEGAKKFAKPEARALVDEFEQRLEALHKKGMDEDEVATKANEAANAARNKGRRTPGRRGRGRGVRSPRGKTPRTASRRSRSDDDEDSDDSTMSDFVAPQHPASRRKRAPSGRTTKKRVTKISFSDEEDSDIDLFEVEEKTTDEPPNPMGASDSENTDPNTLLQSALTPRPAHLRKKAHGRSGQPAAAAAASSAAGAGGQVGESPVLPSRTRRKAIT